MIQCLNSQKQHYLHLTFEMTLMLQVAIATGTPIKLFTTAKAAINIMYNFLQVI